MKVLQIINSLSIGGAERLILDSISYYIDLGVQMEVLLLDDSISSFRNEFEEKYPNVRIIGLTKGSIYNPLLIFKIIPYLKNYDLVHLHLFPTLYWGCFAKLISFNKIKIVYTEHNTNNRRRNHFLLSRIDKIVYKYVSNIGCITQSVSDELVNFLGVKFKDRIFVIENGISLSKFDTYGYSTNEEFPFKKEDCEDIILLQISNFKKQKDQVTVIRAMKLLPNRYKLVLVGDGETKETCYKLAKELGVLDRVHFLGQRTDVVEIVQASDIVILSSHWEGFGLAIVEGMASKKPVIVSNVDGLSSIVRGYGLVFEKGNEGDLKDKVLSLSKKEYYEYISEQCLIRSKNYDISTMVSKYMKFYEKTINS